MKDKREKMREELSKILGVLYDTKVDKIIEYMQGCINNTTKELYMLLDQKERLTKENAQQLQEINNLNMEKFKLDCKYTDLKQSIAECEGLPEKPNPCSCGGNAFCEECNITVAISNTIDQSRIYVAKLNNKIKELEEENKDFMDYVNNVVDTACNKDEEHCACVPGLLKNIDNLKQRLQDIKARESDDTCK